jgi:hypothetical protein
MDLLQRFGVLSAGMLLCAAQAHACGVCVEDKMAATYDHAVMQRASAEHKTVVFCEVRGPVQDARFRDAAARVRGIDAGTVRTSSEPAALSFMVDPRVLGPEDAIAQLQKALGPGVGLTRITTGAPAP